MKNLDSEVPFYIDETEGLSALSKGMDNFLIAMEELMPTKRQVPVLPAGAFPAPSLKVWMELVEKAGVLAVPATVVAELSLDALLHYEDFTEAENPELAAKVADKLLQLNNDLPSGYMLRWDCCAPLGVKGALSDGIRGNVAEMTCLHKNDLELFVADPRAFDILYEFPSETISVLERPWVNARMQGSHPIEFRVFVEKGVVVGVSNYYPQRDLPASSEILSWATRAVEDTKKILAEMIAEGLWPFMPRVELTGNETLLEKINCTLDYLVSSDGVLMFLEAGPGLGFAHPCCFYDDKNRTMRSVVGLALGMKQNLLDLPV